MVFFYYNTIYFLLIEVNRIFFIMNRYYKKKVDINKKLFFITFMTPSCHYPIRVGKVVYFLHIF